MRNIDVFNGDADGICALHQLRLADPSDGELITGVKRDNRLLQRVRAEAGDRVTALDISLAHNRDALLRLLEQGVGVRYFDHHFAGEIPQHALLQAFIDTAADVCTSVIVDRFLGGVHRPWAVVAAFGDNMPQTAARLAATLAIPEPVLGLWRELGQCLNYNAYGQSEADLLYPPAALYRMLRPYREPLGFIAGEPAFDRLRQARQEDMAQALAVPAEIDSSGLTLRRLPDAPWARRVQGSLANHLATSDEGRAHGVLVPGSRGGLMLSLRVPREASAGADEFCRRYGGGGRRVAAGIDDLAADRMQSFTADLVAAYGR